MTTFPELDAATAEASGETLNLPIRGKVYSFDASIPMKRGIEITRMREEIARLLRKKRDDADTSKLSVDEATRVELSDESEIQLYLDLIGEDNRTQMQADGVTWPEMLHVGSTLFAWHFGGEGAARIAWEAKPGDVDPPASPPAKSGGRKTSPSSSNRKKPSSSKATKSGGATTSTGGASSKRTSSASTKSTSQTRKS